MQKLEADLGKLQEGIERLLRLLPGSPGIEAGEELAEAVGFLESCRPRLVRC